MKLTKRGIVACVLALCLVLTAVPAFAFQYITPGVDVETIPEEGVNISIRALGWTGRLRMVLSEETQNLFGVNGNSAKEIFAGTTLSATFRYKNVNGTDKQYLNANGDKFLETFTVVDIPIVSSTPNQAKTSYCLEASADDFRDYSPEIKAAYDAYVQEEGKADNGVPLYFNTNDATEGYEITNVVLKRSTWAGYPDTVTADTLSFPEGTIFVSSANFTNAPATGWKQATNDGYTYYQRNAANAPAGPSLVFKAKESGTYKIWGFVKNRKDSTTRYPRFSLSGTDIEFQKTNAKADTTTFNADKWYWEPEYNDVTFAVQAGDTVVLQLLASCDQNSHFAAIAFVPVEDNFTLTKEQAQSEEYRFPKATFDTLQILTTDKANISAGEAVSVKVNEQEVSAKPGSAKAAGAAVRLVDLGRNYITNPTVLDAVAAAGIDVKGYKNGCIQTKIGTADVDSVVTTITLNGVKVMYPDAIYVKAGDELTVTVPTEVNKNTFAPFNAGVARNTEGNQNGHTKYCMNAGSIPTFARTKEDTGLTGCFFNGYITTKIDYQGTPAGSMVYVNNAKVLSVVAASATGRNDFEIDLKAYNNSAAEAKKVAFIDENGTVYHDTHGYVFQAKYEEGTQKDLLVYNFMNLWVTNAKTEGDIKVFDNGDHYVLTTDAAETCYIIRATYDENGALKSTETEDVFVTLMAPYGIKVAENQKVFVWKNEPFKGTTMQPLCTLIAK